jgi:hypothetical protein
LVGVVKFSNGDCIRACHAHRVPPPQKQGFHRGILGKEYRGCRFSTLLLLVWSDLTHQWAWPETKSLLTFLNFSPALPLGPLLGESESLTLVFLLEIRFSLETQLCEGAERWKCARGTAQALKTEPKHGLKIKPGEGWQRAACVCALLYVCVCAASHIMPLLLHSAPRD